MGDLPSHTADPDAPKAVDPTPGIPIPLAHLDATLEQAEGHLQLQMLLIEVASSNEQADFDLIARAYHFASEHHGGQIRKSGRPFFLQHCVEVARILAQLRLDSTTVAAGLLHDVLEDTPATPEKVTEEFGQKIAALIDGVTKIDRFTFDSREARQAETYRKMLLSMTRDIRVILIKFADRLHNMRTLEHIAPSQQRRVALETLDVFAPLAHRFGLARIRWELEDLSLKYLEPETYQEIADKVAMKRKEREDYIEEFKAPIEEELRKTGIEVEVTGRAKNFFSIYNKMKRRSKPFEEINDLMAIRLIVRSVRECYHTLGLVHTIYHPKPDRFKDYIATPKTNMYQSLHTSVIGPRGLPVEIQIRTAEMHHTAEIGIATHWRCESGDTRPSDLDQHMHWLRQVLDWQRDATDPAEFMESLKIDLFQDEIFIFTPKGDLHQLPQGATPIDFAFAIHTDIGLQCLTAKINGHVVPIATELKSGDTVEIITSSHQKPSQSWLEVAKTTKARHAIRRWLREERHAHSARLGQEMLERELKRCRHNLKSGELEALGKAFDLADSEHLYAAIGSGDLSVVKVVNQLVPHKLSPRPRPRLRDQRGILIQGMDDLMVSFAKCCTPIPGDPIIGLITRGRGISVHRIDCSNTGSVAAEPERLLAVEWNPDEDFAFTVQLRVKSHDRKYLLSDITKVISDTGANIYSSTTRTTGNIAAQDFWVDVKNTGQLSETIEKILKVEGVIEVFRVGETQVSSPSPATS